MTMKKTKTCLILLTVLLLVVTVLVGCGERSLKEKLVGVWYEEGASEPNFVFHSDGTCEIVHEVGTGKWEVVNDDQLVVATYYGEMATFTIVSLKDGCLTLEIDSVSVVFWDTPQD